MLGLVVALALTAHADPWDDVAETSGMSVEACRALVDGRAAKQQSVLDRMATPWEAKPWHAYHPIFLTEERVAGGLAFWSAHEATLAKVADETGVPAEYIVAILGVETRYGEVMGGDRVLDALYTLGFYHERRGRFFRRELGHFLRLATDEGWSLQEPKGSYAGAMGMGQFIPSSYRHYAVDGDGDGDKDLFGSPEDAIGSIANYFVQHGWERGQPVMLPATVDGASLDGLVSGDLKPVSPWSELASQGVGVPAELDAEVAVRLYDFAVADGVEYQVGTENFYVITRYNHSKLYARVVHELAQQLREGRGSPPLGAPRRDPQPTADPRP